MAPNFASQQCHPAKARGFLGDSDGDFEIAIQGDFPKSDQELVYPQNWTELRRFRIAELMIPTDAIDSRSVEILASNLDGGAINLNLGVVDGHSPIRIRWALINNTRSKCYFETVRGDRNCIVWGGGPSVVGIGDKLEGEFMFHPQVWGQGRLAKATIVTRGFEFTINLYGRVGRFAVVNPGHEVHAENLTAQLEVSRTHLLADGIKVIPLQGVSLQSCSECVRVEHDGQTQENSTISGLDYLTITDSFRLVADKKEPCPFNCDVKIIVDDPLHTYEIRQDRLVCRFGLPAGFKVSKYSIDTGFVELPYVSIPFTRSTSVSLPKGIRYVETFYDHPVRGVSVETREDDDQKVCIDILFCDECPVNTAIESEVVVKLIDINKFYDNTYFIRIPILGYILDRR